MNAPKKLLSLTSITALILLQSGCAIGPTYQRPPVAISDHFKEAPGWIAAAPADALAREQWWKLFGDPTLDTLTERVSVSNQNVAAALAAYAQARALAGQQRAALFPAVSITSAAKQANSQASSQNVQFSLGSTWEPDVWGRLQRSVTNATASAQASAGDLATATLSAQGELVSNYLLLRQTDAQRRLLAATIVDYQRVLQITENRYNAGVAPKTDVLQARTQLANAQSEEAGLQRQRAQLEHAIAVLLGETPATFSLTQADWKSAAPEVPLMIPSELLQRRPDIAAAERRMAAANELIGIARSAYYPTISLGASTGASASGVSSLFSNPSSLWSIGVSLTQSVFNAGLVRNRVAGAEAAYEETVARYRQTVLSAFQGVEDQLIAARVLAEQENLLIAASQAADQAEQQVLNRYRAGQLGFLDVVLAQTTALNARRALVLTQSNRQIASLGLIQALGGGWQVAAASN